ncbi:MAG: pyridoxal-phosphate dependent enzyme [Phenylobacterium sp.]
MKHRSVLHTIGDTPVVELSKLAPPGVRLFGKLECFNPMGSVKDRLALAVIERAEREGRLQPGQTVIEATSGNTGIGLAMVCAVKGYPLVITMAESFSVERRRLMRFLGAQVVLTPAAQKGSGMYLKAVELAEAHGWFLTRQFENEANADAHTEYTAREIIRDFEGERLDYFITAVGSGGTLKGVARGLRAARPETRIIAVEPDNAQVMGSGVPQPASAGPGLASHPSFRPHPIQGVSPDFISKLTSDAMAQGLVDEIVPVDAAQSVRLARQLAQAEGVFVGISSGAVLAGALSVAQRAPEGSSILCMLADTGERYLSTPLFDDVPADMSPAELEISRSTPSARFDAAPQLPATAPNRAPQNAIVADPEAEKLIGEALADADQPVVLFSLKWCDFCSSVRELFRRLEIPFRSVDIDSVALQKDELGRRIRQALEVRTGFATIPQVFVGGEFVGGCGETLGAYSSGRLRKLMERTGMTLSAWPDVDPHDLLPKWLHPTD